MNKDIEIDIGNFTAIQKANGVYEYKVKEQVLQKKKVKSQYKEKPQYKLIEHYENVAKLRFKKQLSDTVKQVVVFLKNI